MNAPPIDLQPEHWEIVRRILDGLLPQHEVWAFGSRARRTAKPHSDLDLAVITAEALTLDQTAELAEAFAESDLPFKVDIVDWSRIDERFRKVIEADRVIMQPAASRRPLG